MADQQLQLPLDFDLDEPKSTALPKAPRPVHSRQVGPDDADAVQESSFELLPPQVVFLNEAPPEFDRYAPEPYDDGRDDAPFDDAPFDAPPSHAPGGAERVAPLPAWAARLGVFDLETTGVDTSTARIVTAHIGVLDEHGTVQEQHTWLVDPGVPIPEQATAVHGVTTERARAEGMVAATAVAEIISTLERLFAEGLPLVVYNAPYDLSLLAAEAHRHGMEPIASPSPVVDPLVIDKAVDRFRRGKRTLTAAAGVYGVELVDAHDAGADAVAAGRVAQAMARRYPADLDVEADRLHESQIAWARDQAASFQEYMRLTKNPSFTTSGAWPVRDS